VILSDEVRDRRLNVIIFAVGKCNKCIGAERRVEGWCKFLDFKSGTCKQGLRRITLAIDDKILILI
jgi:hypothetical protein